MHACAVPAKGANWGRSATRKYWLVGVILLIAKVPQFAPNALGRRGWMGALNGAELCCFADSHLRMHLLC